MYYIDLGTEVGVLNSQVVPISQVVSQDRFDCISFQLTGLPTLPPNKAGVVLTKPDYSINLDVGEIEGAVDTDGNCWVQDFTIRHRIYGKAVF